MDNDENLIMVLIPIVVLGIVLALRPVWAEDMTAKISLIVSCQQQIPMYLEANRGERTEYYEIMEMWQDHGKWYAMIDAKPGSERLWFYKETAGLVEQRGEKTTVTKQCERGA